ncbi:MAG: DUF4381 domain-containing protein [Halioglobus sp.]
MNPQDPLANLHPLREPDLLGWWPMAPGWWLLIVITALCLVMLLAVAVKRYRAKAYRRQAVTQLQVLRETYLADQDASQYIAAANALLKSVALRSYPRREIAASSGEQWLQFLNSSTKNTGEFDAGFVTAAYKKDCPAMDMERLHQSAQTWIKQHKVMQ